MTYERYSSQHELQLAQIPVKCRTADRDRPVLDSMPDTVQHTRKHTDPKTGRRCIHIQAITVFTLISIVATAAGREN